MLGVHFLDLQDPWSILRVGRECLEIGIASLYCRMSNPKYSCQHLTIFRSLEDLRFNKCHAPLLTLRNILFQQLSDTSSL